MRVLNFYSAVFADQLRRGRKSATIRLGDKSSKYHKNEAVLVTVGYQHSPREKIFQAVIDGVEVKRFREHDERLLRAQYEVRDDEAALLQSAREARRELEDLFNADVGEGVLGDMVRSPEPR